MSGMIPPFYDLVPAGYFHLIPAHTQAFATEVVTIEAGAVLHVLGKLVLLP